MKLGYKLGVGLLSITLLSGCSIFSRETDVVEMSPLPKVENQFVTKPVWSASVGDGIGKYYSRLSPDYAEGVVYTASRSGQVEALDITSGKLLWQTTTIEKSGLFSSSKSARLAGGVSVNANRVYVGSENGVLYALDAANGALIWKSEAVGEVLSKPVVDEGVVIVHTSNGMLQAFKQDDGKALWTTNLDEPVLSLRGSSTPALAHGAAIVGGDNGRVSAVFLKDGLLIWQQRIAKAGGANEIERLSDVDASPVVVGNLVYAIAYNGNLAALDLSSGQTLWEREVGSINNFTIDKGHIFVVDRNDNVMCLSADSGSVLWKQNQLTYRQLTTPVLMDNNLVVADAEGYVHWLDSTDGKFVSQQRIDSSGFISNPIVADGKLVIQAKSDKIYVLSR